MRYKIDDRVKVKSLDWYNKNKDSNGRIQCGKESFVDDMSEYCGQIATIIEIFDKEYHLNIDDGIWCWTDDMFEGLVEEKSLCEGCCSLELKYDKLIIADNICTDKVEIILQDYELKKEGDKWFAVKKKKEYPKTYEECCRILGLNSEITDSELLFYYPLKCGDFTTIRLPEMEKFEKFIQLYLCRNAYWKIAGEEMGLGKSWEPDWSSCEDKFCITILKNKQTFDESQYISRILAFPTEEMRDAFYENFKNEIEQCKELL